VLASQALVHVLSASRWTTVVDELRDLVEGHYGEPPGPIDPAVKRAVEVLANGRTPQTPVDLDELRDTAEGLAASDEELLLLALFGEEAETLLERIRSRGQRDDREGIAAVDNGRADRIREIVRIVQESNVGEVTIEDDDFRVTVRRTEEAAAGAAAPAPADASAAAVSGTDGLHRVESPMVGTFYRAPQPGAPPFVEVGDVVSNGQTLCLIEAMKLFNELKAEVEGVVRDILVDNAQPVEFGQTLFEVEPLAAPPAI
jgi:oxaloacetate decarboxylase alpha subunit